MANSNRQFFTHDSIDEKHLKAMLANLLVSLILCPQRIYLVSPWITDFPLLDNRARVWDSINPAWGQRIVNFSELLLFSVESGCALSMVLNENRINSSFLQKIEEKNFSSTRIQIVFNDDLHTKGLLTNDFFIAGSMNFTYRGTHKNDERVELITDLEKISEAKIKIITRYQLGDLGAG